MAVDVQLGQPREVGWGTYLWDVFTWDYLGSFRAVELIPGFRFSAMWWGMSAAVLLAAAGMLWMARRVA